MPTAGTRTGTENSNWLEQRPDVTPEKFEAYLHSLYEQPELRERFPNGFDKILRANEK